MLGKDRLRMTVPLCMSLLIQVNVLVNLCVTESQPGEAPTSSKNSDREKFLKYRILLRWHVQRYPVLDVFRNAETCQKSLFFLLLQVWKTWGRVTEA